MRAWDQPPARPWLGRIKLQAEWLAFRDIFEIGGLAAGGGVFLGDEDGAAELGSGINWLGAALNRKRQGRKVSSVFALETVPQTGKVS